MAIADETPVICSAGVASPCGLDLLDAAGVPVSREIRTYRTAEDFQRLVGDVIGNGERLLCQHVHDEDDVPAEACLVAPALLRYLNNKGNLPAIVGAERRAAALVDRRRGRRGAARRRVVGPEGLLGLLLRRRIRRLRPPGGDHDRAAGLRAARRRADRRGVPRPRRELVRALLRRGDRRAAADRRDRAADLRHRRLRRQPRRRHRPAAGRGRALPGRRRARARARVHRLLRHRHGADVLAAR